MAASALTRAYALSLALNGLTGSPAIVSEDPGGVVITLTPENRRWLENLLETALTPGGGGDIRYVGLKEALSPPLVRRAVPIGISLLVAGVLIGFGVKK